MANHIIFQDNSNLEYELDLYKFPIRLCYFSIAFNGMTWYERHFDARIQDPTKHQQYRESVNKLLYRTESKSSITHTQFLQMIIPPMEERCFYGQQPTMELVDEIMPFYDRAETWDDFFQSIPHQDRCRLIGKWIQHFMVRFLGHIADMDWIIPLPFVSHDELRDEASFLPQQSVCLHNFVVPTSGQFVDRAWIEEPDYQEQLHDTRPYYSPENLSIIHKNRVYMDVGVNAEDV
jgi:hypothetical protein